MRVQMNPYVYRHVNVSADMHIYICLCMSAHTHMQKGKAEKHAQEKQHPHQEFWVTARRVAMLRQDWRPQEYFLHLGSATQLPLL